ncbi:MAG: thiamine-phosphate kinase [Candidatus Aminicenantes bacterium]|jgi:thiamine-monophosphate kinase
MMDQIFENRAIDRIAGNFLKSPHKIGNTHESDAEIIELGDSSKNYLAVTTDALVEEVASGLYDDPHFIGWMLAMVNFSDLAAVGADPLGLLLTISYSPDSTKNFITKLARGVSDACSEINTFVLGGDTNQGRDLLLSGCAVGLVPKQCAMTRLGAKVGDRLYITYPAGLGNIYAFLKLSRMNRLLPGSFYRPVARIREGRVIRNYASSCMDSSDGVLHTVDTLMRLNGRRFILYDNWGRILHPMAYRITRLKRIPPWLVLAGIHGEYELVFTVSTSKEREFLAVAKRIGWKPLLIGEVSEGLGVSIKNSRGLIPLDTASIRNLSEYAGSDPRTYVKELIQMAAASGIH